MTQHSGAVQGTGASISSTGQQPAYATGTSATAANSGSYGQQQQYSQSAVGASYGTAAVPPGTDYGTTGSTYPTTGSTYPTTGSTYPTTGSTYPTTGSAYPTTGSTASTGGTGVYSAHAQSGYSNPAESSYSTQATDGSYAAQPSVGTGIYNGQGQHVSSTGTTGEAGAAGSSYTISQQAAGSGTYSVPSYPTSSYSSQTTGPAPGTSSYPASSTQVGGTPTGVGATPQQVGASSYTAASAPQQAGAADASTAGASVRAYGVATSTSGYPMQATGSVSAVGYPGSGTAPSSTYPGAGVAALSSDGTSGSRGFHQQHGVSTGYDGSVSGTNGLNRGAAAQDSARNGSAAAVGSTASASGLPQGQLSQQGSMQPGYGVVQQGYAGYISGSGGQQAQQASTYTNGYGPQAQTSTGGQASQSSTSDLAGAAAAYAAQQRGQQPPSNVTSSTMQIPGSSNGAADQYSSTTGQPSSSHQSDPQGAPQGQASGQYAGSYGSQSQHQPSPFGAPPSSQQSSGAVTSQYNSSQTQWGPRHGGQGQAQSASPHGGYDQYNTNSSYPGALFSAPSSSPAPASGPGYAYNSRGAAAGGASMARPNPTGWRNGGTNSDALGMGRSGSGVSSSGSNTNIGGPYGPGPRGDLARRMDMPIGARATGGGSNGMGLGPRQDTPYSSGANAGMVGMGGSPSNMSTSARNPLGGPKVQQPGMPQRPGMPECAYFMKTGACRFALSCKFHHPYELRPNPTPAAQRSSSVVSSQERAPCDTYLESGVCNFGDKCRFRHASKAQLEEEQAMGFRHPDPNDLPSRPGMDPCKFYARTGKCAFGMKCKFDHPEHLKAAAANMARTGLASSASSTMPGENRMVASGSSLSSHAPEQTGSNKKSPTPLSTSVPQQRKAATSDLKEVYARHILIKHKGSRRPASWKDPEGAMIKQRTVEEATRMLRDLRESVKSPDDFAKVATTSSDCSSAKRGGDLGSFVRGKMQRAFEDAAFGLAVGGLSDVVATDSGVHLIMRTG
ncbi:unnamed protein product [Choristocarpus tenellus]